MGRTAMENEILDLLKRKYQEKEDMLGTELLRETERMLMLNVIDSQWKDHLLSMDHLKEGISLRSYGQKDPLVEYKKESFKLFQDMMDRIEDETIRYLFFMQRVEQVPEPGQDVDWAEAEDPEAEAEAAAIAAAREAEAKAAQTSVIDFTRNVQRKKERELADLQFVGGGEASKPKQPVLAKKTVGRNDPCPCGSGKKYKKCCAA
jgi:preprotein translocase subunit SecA